MANTPKISPETCTDFWIKAYMKRDLIFVKKGMRPKMNRTFLLPVAIEMFPGRPIETVKILFQEILTIKNLEKKALKLKKNSYKAPVVETQKPVIFPVYKPQYTQGRLF